MESQKSQIQLSIWNIYAYIYLNVILNVKLNIYAYTFYIFTFKIYSEEIICCETHWSAFIKHKIKLKNKTFRGYVIEYTDF